MGGDSQGQSYVNVTNNLFINGPSGGGNAITSGNSDFHIYATDNWQDRNRNGVYDPYEIPRDEYTGGPTFEEEPFAYPELDTWTANELVDKLLPDVGATLPYRDMVDFYMVHQVKSFGTEGALISTEEQLPFGVPSSWTLKEFDKPVDTDGDGMPDDWEQANGTDPSKDDAIFVSQSRTIRSLAHKGECVIVGRLANWILRDDPHVVRVFVGSGAGEAARRVARQLGIGTDEAARKAARVNSGRAIHCRHYTGVRWASPAAYDLMVNTDRMGIEGTVATIIGAVVRSRKAAAATGPAR